MIPSYMSHNDTQIPEMCFVLICISMYKYVLGLYLYASAGIGMYYNNMSEKWLSTKTRIGLY